MQKGLVYNFRDDVIKVLLPLLLEKASKSHTCAQRFSMLKLATDCVVSFIQLLQSPSAHVDDNIDSLFDIYDHHIRKYLLPRCAQLLTDDHPIPLYTQKLLLAIFDTSSPGGWPFD